MNFTRQQVSHNHFLKGDNHIVRLCAQDWLEMDDKINQYQKLKSFIIQIIDLDFSSRSGIQIEIDEFYRK